MDFAQVGDEFAQGPASEGLTELGGAVAVWMTKSSSSGVSRRGRPPAH